MRVPFTKMHGLGNDFVVLDARAAAVPGMTGALAAGIADRHTGIGCDQLIVLEPADDADLTMRIFNADGGEVEACGNAARAITVLEGRDISIATGGGRITASLEDGMAAVDMGEPRFDWDAIPLAYAMDTHTMPVGWDGLDGPGAVNVGNPHVVFFVDDLDQLDCAALGSRIETDPLFPDRINVNFAQVLNRQTIRLVVWERGVGLTRACGTGACATAVAAARRGLTGREVDVRLPGGSLTIHWTDANRIMMRGPAQVSYTGTFDPADLA